MIPTSTMAPKLYVIPGSPPCRAVVITAKALGITLDIHVLRADKGELESPEFLKINPQHKVPALYDDGHIICDSHAINGYLVAKYGKDDSLYPKDAYKKAVVDEKLYFDAAELFPYMSSILGALISKEIKSIPPQRVDLVKNCYGVLEKFLEVQPWVTGDSVTIADFSILATITSLEVIVELDPKTYPKIIAYIKRGKALPWFAGDEEEVIAFSNWYKSLLV